MFRDRLAPFGLPYVTMAANPHGHQGVALAWAKALLRSAGHDASACGYAGCTRAPTVVDHDHDTGLVLDVLCHRCNHRSRAIAACSLPPCEGRNAVGYAALLGAFGQTSGIGDRSRVHPIRYA